MNNWRDLPRKKKKRLYGTRGNRKSLALALLDGPRQIRKIIKEIYSPDYSGLKILTDYMKDENYKYNYTWKINE